MMTVNKDVSTRDTLMDCLLQQIDEYEVLKSMYTDYGEIVLSDKHVIDEIQMFLNNQSAQIPSHLDYKVNLQVNNLKLEVFVNLPSWYPKKEPDINVRCNQLNRAGESRLNGELYNYIKSNHLGEVCIYTAISWLQENIDQFTNVMQDSHPTSNKESETNNHEFARFWIYSHHIYSKRKREEIMKRSRDLKLTGYMLSGKPGIICVEGHYSDCKDWWKYIKSMNWQKIVLRKTEIFLSCEEQTYKKFLTFEELHFSKSDFAKFMNELGLNNDFNELFGLCNDD